jgi:hypothetical protein
MNPSERLLKILSKKENLIDTYRLQMEVFAINMQTSLFNELLDKTLSNLQTENGIILNTPKNIRLLTQVDAVLNDMSKNKYPSLISTLQTGFTKLNAINDGYFIGMMGATAMTQKATDYAKVVMRARIGITEGGEMIKDGWMASLIQDKTVLKGVKNIVFKAVVSQSKFSDTLNNLKDYIQGTPESGGSYEKYMKNSLYDVFQQHDAAYSQSIATTLELKYFLYEGGLVKDSRDFCREHNGHVYNIDDAETWPTWVPADSIHISDFKQKDEYSIPSYLGYPDYNPLIDRGGYNCRHFLSYISDALAKKWRDEESN